MVLTSMPFPAGASDEDFCYLTTIGRVTGRPRTIEIWFVLTAQTVYLLAGGGWAAQWVQNLSRDPAVELSIGGCARRGRARIVSDGAEDRHARRLLLGKYGPRVERYRRRWGGDIERWGRSPLAVAIDLDGDDAQRRAARGSLSFRRVGR